MKKGRTPDERHILFDDYDNDMEIKLDFTKAKINRFIELWQGGESLSEISRKLQIKIVEAGLIAIDLDLRGYIAPRPHGIFDPPKKGLRKQLLQHNGVSVYQVCEDEAVAAKTASEAKQWYKNLTGLNEKDIFGDRDIRRIDLNGVYYVDMDNTKKRLLKDVIEEEWQGEPFIALYSVN